MSEDALDLPSEEEEEDDVSAMVSAVSASDEGFEAPSSSIRAALTHN